MKAKDIVEKIVMANNPTQMTDEMAWRMVTETTEMIKSRGAKTSGAISGVVAEMINKWDAVCRQLKKDFNFVIDSGLYEKNLSRKNRYLLQIHERESYILILKKAAGK